MSTDRLTEILNYLSAMSRDVGEFRQETRARFDGLETRIEQVEIRIEKLETEMRAGFEQVRTDIRQPKRKIEILTEDSMELCVDGRDLRKRMEAVETKLRITDSV